MYIVASTTGIIHNIEIDEEVRKEGKSNLSMIVMFWFFLVMNVIALVRNLT